MTEQQLNKIVLSVTNHADDAVDLKLLGDIACSAGSSVAFVNAILASYLSSGLTVETAISKTMQTLERTAAKAELTGCLLMVYLWPFADESLMHDICDAIDLWIAQSESIELKQQLGQIKGVRESAGKSRANQRGQDSLI